SCLGRVERKTGPRAALFVIAPPGEETFPQSRLVSSFEKARRDDLIRIDVFLCHHDDRRHQPAERIHSHLVSSRGSAMRPAMAAAAAVSGLARKVRPPGP